jgi:hypothetical protein
VVPLPVVEEGVVGAVEAELACLVEVAEVCVF